MQATRNGRLEIPESLRRKLLAFRRRVWAVKLIEAVAGAAIGVLVGYLTTYALDRLFDTPRLLRGLIFAGAVATCGLIPWALEHWVRRRRRLDQLARLLTHRHPAIGDRLLGIIELAGNESEQARSPALVRAAIAQVSEEAAQRDFRDGVPQPRHVRRTWTAGILAVCAAVLLVATGSAARNAWARFLSPWKPVPRYTFAAVEPLPERIVVPHGEPFEFGVRLAEGSEWTPEQAEARLAAHRPVRAPQQDGGYRFELPSLITATELSVRVGDYSGRTTIEPMLRPELNALHAHIELPEYLGRSVAIEKDIRGGSLSAVLGSRATVTATVSRALARAKVDREPHIPDGATFSTGPLPIGDARELRLEWEDQHGLTSQEPFVLSIAGVEDAAPSLVCENMPRMRVLLDSEMVSFQVRARDDFGVKRVGIEWKGLDTSLSDPAHGERMIGAGAPDAESLDLTATFSAAAFEIEPQPIAVRVFAEDYLPGRERVYSPACVFHVLNAEEHAIWVTAQLSRWHRMALDVRDRELQLFEINKELRELPPEELDRPETRRRIETQAAAERSNERRLSNLVIAGDDLLKQAMRNPEIGVGHLENWAEMMQILRDIAGNRMPSVADLLKQAAQAPPVAQNSSGNKAPVAGQNRLAGAGSEPNPGGDPKPPTAVPAITDIESSHNQQGPGEPKEPSESNGSQPRLTLPTTMLAGTGSGGQLPCPAGGKTDEAVREQQDLLAEFEKIADELNRILANLEGSTLVKRLKAASRKQQQVALKLGSIVSDTFGASDRAKEPQAETFRELSEVEALSSQTVSHIMDDMAAYFDRSRFIRFKVVLDDMRAQDITAALRNLSDDLRKENGLSISQAEYWGETLDRWAEDLVDVCKSGACPGCRSKGSLPPSIVLEVLQILEGEINLREETRVAEQSRPAVPSDEHGRTAGRLSETQDALRERIERVIDRILELPDAQADFASEIHLLRAVSPVMGDAAAILATGETGSAAIAAETEAIELLLQSKRFNPRGGGGGGSNPGGGGGGDTSDSALALVGSGVNEKAVNEERPVSQSTGPSGPILPEEFRAGLDEYFNRLDQPQD